MTGRDDLHAQLQALASELGIDASVDLIVSEGPISHAEAPRRGRAARIEIGTAAFAAGGSVLRGTLAHELAHVRDPHELRDRALRCAVAVGVGLPALFALMIFPELAPVHTSRVLVIATWCAGWPLLFAALACAARISHRRELRADRTAAELLGDTQPVLAMIDGIAFILATYNAAGRLHARLTHPDPQHRRRALTSPASAHTPNK